MVDDRRPHPAETPRPSVPLLVFGFDELCLVVTVLALLTAFHVRLSGKQASISTGFSSDWRIALSPDGSLVASTTPVGSGVYDLEMGRLLYLLPGDLCSIEFSRDSSKLLLAEPDGKVRLLDARSGRRIRAWEVKAPSLEIARLHPDGDLVVAAGPAGPVEVLSLGDAALQAEIDPGLARVRDISFAKVAGLLGVLGQDDTTGSVVQLWDVRSARLHKTLPIPGTLELGFEASFDPRSPVGGGALVAISPDASRVAMVLKSPPRLGLLDVSTGALSTQTPRGWTLGLKRIEFSPTGRYIFFDFPDETPERGSVESARTTLWDLDNGALKAGPKYEGGITDVQFLDRDRTMAVAGHSRRSVLFWDVETSELLRETNARVAQAVMASRPALWPVRIGLAVWIVLWFLAYRRRRRHPERHTGRAARGVFLLPFVVSVCVVKGEFMWDVVTIWRGLLPTSLPEGFEAVPAVALFTLILGTGLFSLLRLLLGFTSRFRSRLIFTAPSVGIAAWTIFSTSPLGVSVWSLVIPYLH